MRDSFFCKEEFATHAISEFGRGVLLNSTPKMTDSGRFLFTADIAGPSANGIQLEPNPGVDSRECL